MEETTLVETIQAIVGFVLTTSGAAAWLSTFLSDAGGGGVGKFIMGLLNVVAGNVGKAKNDAASQ